MRTLRVAEEATEELTEIIDFLDEKGTTLSTTFAEEYEGIVRNLLEHPEMYQRVEDVKSKTCRRATMRTMSYSLIYSVEGENILVVSVHHTSQEPTHWHRRVAK